MERGSTGELSLFFMFISQLDFKVTTVGLAFFKIQFSSVEIFQNIYFIYFSFKIIAMDEN